MSAAHEADLEWRKFELYRTSLAATGKSQARFVATLLSFLALLWGWYYMQPSELSVQFFGATLRVNGLWTVAPAILTVLVLAIVGSMNLMGPIWKRMRLCAEALGQQFLWTDLDPNKTLIEFFSYLRLSPYGAVEPYSLPAAEPRHRWPVFTYPLVLSFATFTTAKADYSGASYRYRIYIYGCVVIQTVFLLRIWWRAVCKFFGWKKDETEI